MKVKCNWRNCKATFCGHHEEHERSYSCVHDYGFRCLDVECLPTSIPELQKYRLIELEEDE